jgi:GNAT superfamily N-acetyltransferase
VALREKNIFQWNDWYPSRERLAKDIKLEELYVYEENAEIIGMVVLTPVMDEEYEPIDWLTPDGRNLYVHRLATHPDVWGRGYGKKLMDFAETFALENNYRSVRLDTFSRNKRNQKFYENRDYKRLGNIYFPKQSEFPFFCYEKVLS